MKTKLLLLAVLAVSPLAQAVTTVQLGTGGGFLTNLQNSAGLANQTLVWGILVDTGGNGFQGGSYLPGFTLSDTTASPNGQLLSTTGGATDDRLFLSTNLMSTGGTGDGSTGLAKPTNVLLSYSVDGAAGVSAAGGQSVAIVWFDYTAKSGQATVNGDKYGLFILPFTTPADTLGGSQSFGANFIGADPARPANLTLGTAVPEPSAALLGAIGALGLIRRRRN